MVVNNQSEPPEIDRHVPDDLELRALSEEVGSVLLANTLTCATAESCTGGLVAKLLTDIAGSSAWFVGGFVCYSNETKHSMLAVPSEVIEAAGAVSREVVLALSANAVAKTGADVAVALSGVAGPGGGSPQKPVGTVWVGWATSGSAAARQSTVAEQGKHGYQGAIQFVFCGDRDQIRRAAAGRALRGILEIQQSGKVSGSSLCLS